MFAVESLVDARVIVFLIRRSHSISFTIAGVTLTTCALVHPVGLHRRRPTVVSFALPSHPTEGAASGVVKVLEESRRVDGASVLSSSAAAVNDLLMYRRLTGAPVGRLEVTLRAGAGTSGETRRGEACCDDFVSRAFERAGWIVVRGWDQAESQSTSHLHRACVVACVQGRPGTHTPPSNRQALCWRCYAPLPQV